jgi:superfamily II DNA helicase RecQ
MLGQLAGIFPQVPRLAVTATADARTREDIRTELRLADALEFVDSFARPELALSAERKHGKGHGRVLELVAERPKRSGVIYAGSRDGVDKLAEKLAAAGVPALAYHAGLAKDVRAARLEQFLEAETAVMVATIAFGMGVDKPDIRFVIHADPPASIEAYWQEIGRAGRKAVYRGERRVSMLRMTAGEETAGRSRRARKRYSGERLGVEAADAPLFEALRAWRRERAAEQRVPPYVIFHDTTLSAIARERPASADELAKVSGVGQGKLKRYGADVLKVVRAN